MTWLSGDRLRRALVWLCAAKLTGVVLLLSTTASSAFDLPKALWSHGTAWLLLALLLALGARRRTVEFGRLPLLAAAVLLLAVLAGLFASNPVTALFGMPNRYLGLTFFLDMAVLVAALAVGVRGATEWRILAGAGAFSAIVVMAYAGVQYAGLDPLGVALAGGRPFSTFGNPNMLGHYLSCLVAAAVGVAAFGGSRRLRLAATALAIAAAIAILVVATRGALVGLLAILLVGGALALRRGPRIDRRALAGAAAAVLVGGAILTVSPLGARVTAALDDSSTAERLLLYRTSLRMIAAQPLFGYGPDNFANGFIRHREPESEALHNGAVLADQAHDWFLHYAATTGLPAALALLALVVATARRLWGRGMREAPHYAGPLLLVHVTYWANALIAVEAVSVSWIPWAVLGLTVALVPSQHTWRFRLPPARAALPLALVAVVLSVTGISAYRASEANERAAQAFRAGDPRATADAAHEAVALDPHRGGYWNFRGLGREGRGLTELALADYEQAIRLNPEQANYWANRARMMTTLALGGSLPRTTALAAARDAVAADPQLSTPRRVYAALARALGQPEAALREAVLAIRLYPHGDDGPVLAAAVAADVTQRAVARDLLREALRSQSHPALWVALAIAHRDLGDGAAARDAAATAATLDPRNAEAQRLLMDLR